MLRTKLFTTPGFSLLCALLLLPCARMTAQYTTADLGGTVVDSTGAAVPGAKVTARNTETGFSQDTTTSATGAFLFPRLRVGAYELRVEKDGFSTYVQSGITLVVDQAANVSIALKSDRCQTR